MHLLSLPEEVLREIFNRLDFESKVNTWEALECVRHVLRSTLFKTVYLSGDDSLLWLPALVDFAPRITDLDLSGLRQLTLDVARPALTKFTNLRSLDVSKTSLDMYQAASLCDVYPNITTLALHFDWPSLNDMFDNGEQHCADAMTRVQNSLSRLHHVTFDTTSPDLLECGHMFYVLQRASHILTLHINIICGKKTLSHHHFGCFPLVPPSLRVITVFNESSLGDVDLSNNFVPYSFDDWEILGIYQEETRPRMYVTTPKLTNDDMYSNHKCHRMIVNHKIFKNFMHLYMLHKDLEQYNSKLYEIFLEKIKNTEGTVKCISEKRFGRDKAYVCPCTLPVLKISDALPLGVTVMILFGVEPKLLAIQLKPDENITKLCLFPCFCHESNKSTMLFLTPNAQPFESITFLCIMYCNWDNSIGYVFTTFRNLTTLRLIAIDRKKGCYYRILSNIHESRKLKELVYIDRDVTDDEVLEACATCPTLERIEYVPSQERPMKKRASFIDTRESVPEWLTPSRDTLNMLLSGCPALNKIVLHCRKSTTYPTELRNYFLSNMPNRICLDIECKVCKVNYSVLGYMFYDEVCRRDPLNVMKDIKFR